MRCYQTREFESQNFLYFSEFFVVIGNITVNFGRSSHLLLFHHKIVNFYNCAIKNDIFAMQPIAITSQSKLKDFREY